MSSKATVKVRARLGNPTSLKDEVEVALEVRDSQNNLVHSTTQKLSPWSGELEIAAFTIATPQLWSPRSPSLYRCNVTIKTKHGEQQVVERFGVRSVEWVEHGPFKLNGERLLLRGTHYHEDHAGVTAAVPDDVVRKTLQQIKDMGANFVRLGHYQQAPLVLELCDELGLLVWEEIPWCRGGLGGPRYQQQCRDMLRNMIGQHYNHPSVILWGLGNENDWPGDFDGFGTNAIRNCMGELNTLAHQLDPSRKTTIRRCDFCKDIPDVYSPSIWAGWYGGRYTEYRKSTEKAIADTPHFFHAEWDGDSLAGRHSEEPEKFLNQVATGEGTAEVGKAYKANGGKARASKDGDWSESYIINLFDWHLKEQETMPNLTGSAQWIFKDFATPLRPENPVPRVNQKGVVERDGAPKESYYVFQSYWAEKPMLHIYGHTWPVRWGKPGEPRQVKVFSNCREAELFVNGVSVGVKQRNPADFPAAGLRWMVKFNEGTNTLRALGHSTNGDLSDEARLAECRRQFKELFVPKQMAADGSFPQELRRTKSYAYSIFQLDNTTTLCQVLSTPADDLWEFELPDGRSIRKAVSYLYPFLADKSKWPLKPDVQAWDGWPARQSCLLFAGLAFGDSQYLELWKNLQPDPVDEEVQRNIAITQPVLWMKNQ